MRTRIAALVAASSLVAVPVAVAATQSVTLTSTVKPGDSGPGGTIKVTGTVSGKPFGAGKVTYLAKPAPGSKLNITYTATFPKGTITGTAAVTVSMGPTTRYAGTLKITKGTKAFKGVKGTGLKVTGSSVSPTSGQAATIKLKVTGKVSGL